MICNIIYLSKTNILKLSTDNLTTLTKAKSAHSKLLKKDYNRIYFNLNSLLLLPSAIASIAAFIFVAVSGALTIFAGVVSIAILVIHLLFLYLMRAPSIKGRLLMDRLEGFKEYLKVAERDDLNLRNPPNLTPDLFEAYLPYALAFAAGAMIYVVVEEVIPETQMDRYTDVATLGFIGGFLIMMLLDVGLG